MPSTTTRLLGAGNVASAQSAYGPWASAFGTAACLRMRVPSRRWMTYSTHGPTSTLAAAANGKMSAIAVSCPADSTDEPANASENESRNGVANDFTSPRNPRLTNAATTT